MSGLDIGLHLIELATNFRFNEMRELARAGLRESAPHRRRATAPSGR